MSFARQHGVDDDLAARRGNVRYDFGDALAVEIREARREPLRFLLIVLVDLAFLLFDDRCDDDIIGAEEAHLLENLLFGALADGKHGNDGRDAEEDA